MSTTTSRDESKPGPSPAATSIQHEGDTPDGSTMVLAVVANPSKFTDLDAVRAQITDGCLAHGGIDARWYETTKEDPGAGQAQQALRDGATVVCSLGGDGTVRSVASALIGTGVPLGLLPGGTGNLLARNLGLPVDDLDAALATVLTGVDRSIDAGAVSWDDDPEQVFVVMAGMGMDATMIGEADERIKDAVGWPAYLLSGVKALFNRGFAVAASAHGQRAHSRRARMVVVGNCGELTGGVKLLPEARLDDGKLDLALVAPRGVVGWLALLREVLTTRWSSRRAVRHMTADVFELTLGRPVEAELDGDPVGERKRMRTRALPGALVVRAPHADRGPARP